MVKAKENDMPDAATTTRKRRVETGPRMARPMQIFAWFGLVGPDGNPIDVPPGAKLVITETTRDVIAGYRKALKEGGLFAELEIPRGSGDVQVPQVPQPEAASNPLQDEASL